MSTSTASIRPLPLAKPGGRDGGRNHCHTAYATPAASTTRTILDSQAFDTVMRIRRLGF
jgi:hypothetical protein